jgi:hypothetical protein
MQDNMRARGEAMLAAFSIDELLKGFGFLTLVLFVLIILVKKLRGITIGKQISLGGGIARLVVAVGGLMTQAVGIAGLMLWLADITHAWRPVWSALGLSQSVFPDLNGSWKGIILSNGPQHGYTDICPRTGSATANCASSNPTKFVCLPVEVIGTMTLLTTDLELILCNFHSHSTAVSLKRRTRTYNAELTYTFKVPSQPPTGPDTEPFEGSAILEVDNKRSMQGYYWTNRYWKEGRQTAGSIELMPQ